MLKLVWLVQTKTTLIVSKSTSLLLGTSSRFGWNVFLSFFLRRGPGPDPMGFTENGVLWVMFLCQYFWYVMIMFLSVYLVSSGRLFQGTWLSLSSTPLRPRPLDTPVKYLQPYYLNSRFLFIRNWTDYVVYFTWGIFSFWNEFSFLVYNRTFFYPYYRNTGSVTLTKYFVLKFSCLVFRFWTK